MSLTPNQIVGESTHRLNQAVDIGLHECVFLSLRTNGVSCLLRLEQDFTWKQIYARGLIFAGQFSICEGPDDAVVAEFTVENVGAAGGGGLTELMIR